MRIVWGFRGVRSAKLQAVTSLTTIVLLKLTFTSRRLLQQIIKIIKIKRNSVCTFDRTSGRIIRKRKSCDSMLASFRKTIMEQNFENRYLDESSKNIWKIEKFRKKTQIRINILRRSVVKILRLRSIYFSSVSDSKIRSSIFYYTVLLFDQF